MNLKLLTPEEFKHRCPDLDLPSNLFFLIMKNQEEAGLYILSRHKDRTCEIHLELKENHKYKVLTKNTILHMLNFPFSLGFKTVVFWTEIKSFARLLSSFKKYGLNKIDKQFQDGRRTWFYKQGDI